MTRKNRKFDTFKSLRERAEQIIAEQPKDPIDIDTNDLVRLIQEIEVYQVELELQNEELRRSTTELETARDEYYELYENAPVGFVTVNKSGIIEQYNSAARQMLAGPDDNLTGRSFAVRVFPEDQELYLSCLKNIAVTGMASPCELRLVRKNGSLIHVHFEATARKDPECRITHWRLALVDITLRKEAEEQLLQARKMEAMGRLAGGVAHEFNNMLNVIHGNAELIGFRLDPEDPLQGFVGEITAAAMRAAEMADQLLACSGKQVSVPKVVDINRMVHDHLWMVKQVTGEKIEVRFHPGGDLWPVRLDPDQLLRILDNLTVNARDAISGAGEVTITTENHPLDPSAGITDLPPGDYVRLSFRDNGSGMEENVRERIFDPYFTTRDVGKGPGLGLPTVYGIVRQNDGGIEVHSKPDQGTTFHIYFPRYRAPSSS